VYVRILNYTGRIVLLCPTLQEPNRRSGNMPVYQRTLSLVTGIFTVMLRAGEAVKVSHHFVKPLHIVTVQIRHAL
jgi:hypothetical protein